MKRVTVHSVFAALFALVIFTDFIVMPFWYMWFNTHLSPEQMLALAGQINGGKDIVAILTILHQQSEYQPISLAQNGLLYISLGAILGIGQWKKLDGANSQNSPQ